MTVTVIHSQRELLHFPKTEAYKSIVAFLNTASDSVRGKPHGGVLEPSPGAEVLAAVVGVLAELEEWADQIPLQEKASQRFGNRAFRVWHQRLCEGAAGLVTRILTAGCNKDPGLLEHTAELSDYLTDSFGNPTRIDYGTGHELHFLCFLLCLFALKILGPSDLPSAILEVFGRAYLTLMRKLQAVYSLEPAGSKGVYGLDDYHHLPFLFGASQLVGNQEGLSPADIMKPAVVRDQASRYMYFGCIQWILQEKSGPFAEHSSILYDISGVPEWKKVASGMLKMYQGEVLSKFPIVQHLRFGSVLRFEPPVP